MTENCWLSVPLSGEKQTGCLCKCPRAQGEEGNAAQHGGRQDSHLCFCYSQPYLWRKALASFLEWEISGPSGGHRACNLLEDLQLINTVTELQVIGERKELLEAGHLAGLGTCWSFSLLWLFLTWIITEKPGTPQAKMNPFPFRAFGCFGENTWSSLLNARHLRRPGRLAILFTVVLEEALVSIY